MGWKDLRYLYAFHIRSFPYVTSRTQATLIFAQGILINYYPLLKSLRATEMTFKVLRRTFGKTTFKLPDLFFLFL